MSTVEPVTNTVKPASNATIDRAVVVHVANVPKERHVGQTSVPVGYEPVVVVHMSIVSMVSACVRQARVTNATMPVNRMRSASKENVFAKTNVPKVEQLFLLIVFEHQSPCSLVFCPFPCLNGGRCTGFYQCACRQGWQGHRCERRQDRSIAL